jgi:hypothetical protein
MHRTRMRIRLRSSASETPFSTFAPYDAPYDTSVSSKTEEGNARKGVAEGQRIPVGEGIRSEWTRKVGDSKWEGHSQREETGDSQMGRASAGTGSLETETAGGGDLRLLLVHIVATRAVSEEEVASGVIYM